MLGEFEQLVLLAVLRAEGEAYGVTIADALQRATRRDVLMGSVYTTLVRLERKGYLASREGAPTAERGGRRKRLYAVTAAGQRALRTSLAALSRLAAGLDVGLDAT